MPFVFIIERDVLAGYQQHSDFTFYIPSSGAVLEISFQTLKY